MHFVGRILFFLFICPSPLVNAQGNPVSSAYSYPEFNIRTSLTSMLEHDAGIVVGGGIRWSDRFSIALEPGLVFYNTFVSQSVDRHSKSGIKLRADVKYYLSKRTKGRSDWFIAPEFHFKKVRTLKPAEFGINCVGMQCAYFQTAIYKEIKTEAGGLFKIGLSRPFSRKQQQIQFEIFTGLGVKGREFKQKDFPVGGSFLNDPMAAGILFDYYSPIAVMMPTGIKLLFVFLRK